ncbi:MAG: hypothetical protein JNN15_16510 [Blastocatellia bacterium]|nr:hypothetical protein [Blastocatellia bacterium]
MGGKLGSRDEEPFIFLDKQAIYETSGSGENLYIYHPELLDFVMLFAFIFQGARDFSTVRGKMLIREQGGSEIFIQPNFYKPNLILCSFSVIRKIGTNLEVVKEEQYFSNHEEAAQFYGFKL